MIRVVLGEPKASPTECILRSVSSEMEPDTPESRELELGAGSAVLDRLRAMGSLPVGAAVITPGGDLQVPFLIHVVLQSADQPVGKDGLRLALQNGLRRAQEWGLETLSLPPLGTGAGNLGAEEAAEIMVPLLQEHLLRFEHPREAVITVANEYQEAVFSRAVELAGRRASARGN
jgi:O-acetyl-ADP-ribose deacetylase (regulator of RNase III)